MKKCRHHEQSKLTKIPKTDGSSLHLKLATGSPVTFSGQLNTGYTITTEQSVSITEMLTVESNARETTHRNMK